MTCRLYRDIRGSPALEFAVVAPVMLTMFCGAVGLGLALWTLCALENAANQAARCAAISSTACAAVTAGCDSVSPIICYAEQIANYMGVTTVTASEVTLSTTVIAGASFTTIAINHAYSIVGYSFTLRASSSYPQNVTSWIATPAAS